MCGSIREIGVLPCRGIAQQISPFRQAQFPPKSDYFHSPRKGGARKTGNTPTGALLAFCWARAHGMTLMVQDLTNPMLAQVSHVLLAAHAGTIMGVETNAMQFYPQASRPEAEAHPGLYRRRNGLVDLSSLQGPGFGYRIGEIRRALPEPVKKVGKI